MCQRVSGPLGNERVTSGMKIVRGYRYINNYTDWFLAIFRLMVCLSLNYKTDQIWYNSIRCWYYFVFGIISLLVLLVGRERTRCGGLELEKRASQRGLRAPTRCRVSGDMVFLLSRVVSAATTSHRVSLSVVTRSAWRTGGFEESIYSCIRARSDTKSYSNSTFFLFPWSLERGCSLARE